MIKATSALECDNLPSSVAKELQEEDKTWVLSLSYTFCYQVSKDYEAGRACRIWLCGYVDRRKWTFLEWGVCVCVHISCSGGFRGTETAPI